MNFGKHFVRWCRIYNCCKLDWWHYYVWRAWFPILCYLKNITHPLSYCTVSAPKNLDTLPDLLQTLPPQQTKTAKMFRKSAIFIRGMFSVVSLFKLEKLLMKLQHTYNYCWERVCNQREASYREISHINHQINIVLDDNYNPIVKLQLTRHSRDMHENWLEC